MLRARRLAKELEDAREGAKKNWKDIDRGPVEANTAGTDVDKPSGSDGLSLRSSLGEKVPLIGKQENKDDFHPLDWKNPTECTRSL